MNSGDAFPNHLSDFAFGNAGPAPPPYPSRSQAAHG
jgi:hypothetical protein